MALIPARAGSKRIADKNITLLNGKPLIAYTIQAARESKAVDRVIVSTDSTRIADIAREYGADVPFVRPSGIATDDATEFAFHQHALQYMADVEGFQPELIVNLYPTSPFRKAASIDRAIDCIRADRLAHSLRSIRRCAEHPYKMWTFTDDQQIRPLMSTEPGMQSWSYHLLPPVFIQNASIYIVRPSTLSQFGNTIGSRVIGFVMSEEESVDINSPLDLAVAEALFRRLEHDQRV